MFADYPNIACPIYSFNIETKQGNPDNTFGDERVGLTVAVIFNYFFNNIENVALYICDSIDKRQNARKRKFDLWFFVYNDGSLFKEDGLAIVEGEEIYNSLLLHKENFQFKDIILAFKELNEKTSEK
ncbi:DUF6169 family protein [Parasediminibacterium sp. JCM 36343]|uniref:DUF6169 family protein n=1 Tax=Parasediminibacterium sp. JCM 36343 TaxID=3374279 RepID=UPI00397E0A1C